MAFEQARDEARGARIGPPAPIEPKRTSALVVAGALSVFALAVAGIVAAIAVPSYLRARAASAEAAAANQVRSFASAEETYRAVEGRYGAIPDLVSANLVDPDWMNVRERGAYRYSVEVTKNGDGFAIRALPLPTSRNTRAFYVDEGLDLRYADGAAAGPSSPSYGPLEAMGER
jgi:type II secretory pathway pseudopilin PulG